VPGLHDHHIHLLALAAHRRSVLAGPPAARTPAELAVALRQAAVGPAGRSSGVWVRAVGYHESVAGELDRHALDRLVADRPLRVQHRSGAMWMLNSAAVGLLGLDQLRCAGVERDQAGRPTGRILGMDAWLRGRTGECDPPDLGAVGTELLSYGLTGLTDATPSEDRTDIELLAAAVRAHALPQRLMITGGPSLDDAIAPELPRGPVKLIVADHAPPGPEALGAAIAQAHERGRPVALHCVSRLALALALAAFSTAGTRPGDRLEHGAVVPPQEAEQLAALGVGVVTQPVFVAERGDQYGREVEAEDLAHLWPARSLLAAGVKLGGGSDAPFGHPDPWRGIAAAITRRTESGAVLGRHERLSARRALALFLTPPEDPGGPLRRLAPGAPADAVLLHVPLRVALADSSSELVAATICRGEVKIW